MAGGARAIGALLAGLAFTVVVPAGCSNGDGDDEEATALPEGYLLVPGEIDSHELASVERIDPAVRLGEAWDGRGPVVVTDVDGDIVSVSTASVEAVRARDEGSLSPDSDVPAVGDRPTVYYGWNLAPGADMASSMDWLSWLETDDVVVSVASRTLDIKGLQQVAAEVDLDADGGVVAPGRVIGTLPEVWEMPRPGLLAVYRRPAGGGELHVVVLPADRATQNAYLAMAPEGAVNQQTYASCCGSGHGYREGVDVGGRTATITSIDPSRRVLVLTGETGAVVMGNAGDDTLLAIAASLDPVPPDGFERTP